MFYSQGNHLPLLNRNRAKKLQQKLESLGTSRTIGIPIHPLEPSFCPLPSFCLLPSDLCLLPAFCFLPWSLSLLMELVIFIGLQASGKSTFFRQYFASTHELVSKDLMRNNKNRARRQAQLIETALQEGRSVVVDDTNPMLEDRVSLIGIGNRYDAKIIGYYFQSKVRDCLERNQQRAGKARVPDVAIYATIKKLVRVFAPNSIL